MDEMAIAALASHVEDEVAEAVKLCDARSHVEEDEVITPPMASHVEGAETDTEAYASHVDGDERASVVARL